MVIRVQIEEIGVVHNELIEKGKPEDLRKFESTVKIQDEYADGLKEIERSKYLQVIFYFDRSSDYNLVGPRRGGEVRGVFASRSPHRPNNLGSTVVELLSRDGSELRVKGLDAIDGTPVVDIKPYAPPFDKPESAELDRKNPRQVINNLIESGNLEELLLKAGELHGHYCPFLALGIIAGSYAISELGGESADMEKLVSVVETNSCFSDGVQYSTGCTFGNNALVYKDYGKTAVTVAIRGESGVRLYYQRKDYLEKNYPDRTELFEKVVKERNGTEEDERALKQAWTEIAFDLIHEPVEKLFKIGTIRSPSLPQYAPIFEDEHCDLCGEKYMAPKGVETGSGSDLCIPCSGRSYLQLDGSGLKEISD